MHNYELMTLMSLINVFWIDQSIVGAAVNQSISFVPVSELKVDISNVTKTDLNVTCGVDVVITWLKINNIT